MADSDDQHHSKIEPTNYGDNKYWDERYAKSEGNRFEWLQSFDNLQTEIQTAVCFNKSAKILQLGCGNSALQDHLYESGYHSIINIDISSVVIAQMNKVKAERGYNEMIYEVMDVRKLEYPDESFDMVLDKSTIDTLMCSDNPLTNVAAMVDEAYRVLRPGGVYFAVSYASAITRLEHITREHVNWSVTMKDISRLNEEGEKLVHFAYICKKVPLPQERTRKEWRDQHFQKLKKQEQIQYPPS